MRLCRLSLGAVVAAWCCLAGACGDSDRQAIRATMQEVDALTDASRGEEAAALMAPESFDYYERLRRIALDGAAREVHALPAVEQAEVLSMRNRMDRAQLDALDGRGWVVHAVNQGWWRDEESWDVGRVRVRGNSASGTAFIDGEETILTIHFVRVGDRWTVDQRQVDPEWESAIADAAAAEDKSVPEILVQWEEEETGRPVRKDIWDPMKPARKR